MFHVSSNARLRGWQHIPLNSITTTITTAAHWDWKRRALTVPLEAFVMRKFEATKNRNIHHYQ
ncbi:hypothetical protein B4926_18520 [Vibrio cholerae]|nr:hypothetical protein [Vibrio cholerae]MCD1253415.1 hypothetical protein [Vibrio cholerae]